MFIVGTKEKWIYKTTDLLFEMSTSELSVMACNDMHITVPEVDVLENIAFLL